MNIKQTSLIIITLLGLPQLSFTMGIAFATVATYPATYEYYCVKISDVVENDRKITPFGCKDCVVSTVLNKKKTEINQAVCSSCLQESKGTTKTLTTRGSKDELLLCTKIKTTKKEVFNKTRKNWQWTDLSATTNIYFGTETTGIDIGEKKPRVKNFKLWDGQADSANGESYKQHHLTKNLNTTPVAGPKEKTMPSNNSSSKTVEAAK